MESQGSARSHKRAKGINTRRMPAFFREKHGRIRHTDAPICHWSLRQSDILTCIALSGGGADLAVRS